MKILSRLSIKRRLVEKLTEQIVDALGWYPFDAINITLDGKYVDIMIYFNNVDTVLLRHDGEMIVTTIHPKKKIPVRYEITDKWIEYQNKILDKLEELYARGEIE